MPDDVPAERPAVRKVDKSAADTATLVDMGVVDPQPEPVPEPPPGPSPVEQANEAALEAALVEAGVTKAGRDEQVIDVLAKLDPADVEAVARWLKEKKTKPDDPAK
ncbi:hypothetical protein [Streptomyces lunaelactis]|uniref:hypothetical protein n=1 Tax=Streptomyces lunaelactis TaxID=1535768 RepID=UPI001584BF1D|nr:hypothetical protein [Streptomyces lunaelactis]NUL09056.1 hypothetical protein [Streptomyces lunaelactis]